MKIQTRLHAALVAFVIALSFAGGASAGDKGAKGKYLISAPHTAEQCLAVLDDLAEKDKSTLDKMDWGCRDGDHTGYLITDASSAEDALSRLPEKERAGAKAVKLSKFSTAQIKSFHEKK